MKCNIIVPFRNAPTIMRTLECVAREIDRVNSANFGPSVEFECTVVDDASTADDLSSREAERFCGEMSAFSYIRLTSSVKCGGARNAGFDADPSAAYVMFVDADDLLMDNSLVAIAEEMTHGADVIVYGFTKLMRGGKSMTWLPDADLDLDSLARVPVGAWCKCIRRDKFVRFPVGMMCEDCSWWFRQADAVESVATIRQPLYAYDRTSPSFSDAAAWLANNPRTLEGLAFGDELASHGLADACVSGALRNLAEMFDIRKTLKRPSVRAAWAARFRESVIGLMTGRFCY